MSGLANQYNAINLGQGFPDYQMSEELMSKVNEVMHKGWNQYVPMQGYMPLRESISEKVEYLYKTKISPDTQITITPGGTYAIYTALTTILQPADEVIVFEPAYDSYIPNVEINGAIPILIDLKFPEYKIDWAEVRKKISSKTKAILINSPQNPTGAVLGEKDIEELRSIVKDRNIFIVSDEVCGAETPLAREAGERVQLARVVAPQLHTLLDAYARRKPSRLEARGVAQEVLALARGRRPLDARRLVHRLRDGERLPDGAHDGHVRAYQPPRHALRVRRDALDARHQLDEVLQVVEELARRLRARPPLHLLAETRLQLKHVS